MLRKILVLLVVSQSLAFSQVQVRGGELASKNQQLYGRYEIRMRTAQGNGILSTFFTFENDGWMAGTGNPWREIDIEVLGRYNDRFQTNIITGTADGRVTSEFYPMVGVNPADDYHTYAIEWTPDYISFLFDGQEVRRTNAGEAQQQVNACRDIPQSYRFNMWANAISGWVGPFDPAILPRYQFVNWIRYYSYDAASKQFAFSWEDNFESFDTQRWSKGTHSIENFTQFDPRNILVKDGTLILALTDLDGNGLSNITVPADGGTSPIVSRLSSSTVSAASARIFSGKLITSIRLDSPQTVEVRCLDLAGRMVARMQTGRLGAGEHELVVTDKRLVPGVYQVITRVGDKAAVQKMINVKEVN